jgi:hypothetical protein
MGVFGSIFNLGPQGSRYRKAKFKLERAQANKAIQDIESQQRLRAVEDPREQAHMKQSMFARGLGKSTISDQDTSRLTGQQKARNEALTRSLHVATRYKQYLKKRQRYERKSVYSQMLDSLLSMVPLIGGGGQGNQTALGDSSQMSYSGSGGVGDYDYGGGSFV